MTDPVERVAAVAADVARAAGALLLHHFRDGVVAEWKGDRDPVTAADRGAEALIRERLAEAFPDDVVVGEEGEAVAESTVAGRCRWYVDPLDGTTNFLKGQRRWAVSLGRCGADGRVDVAAVHIPCDGETLIAVRGGGTRRDGAVVRATGTGTLGEALVAIGALKRGDADRDAVAAIAGRVMSVRVTGSSVCDLADVACGRSDAFLTTGSGRWDLAAGGLLAEEAGATVTTVDGRPAVGPVETILAAAPALHGELAALLRPEGLGYAGGSAT